MGFALECHTHAAILHRPVKKPLAHIYRRFCHTFSQHHFYDFKLGHTYIGGSVTLFHSIIFTILNLIHLPTCPAKFAELGR